MASSDAIIGRSAAKWLVTGALLSCTICRAQPPTAPDLLKIFLQGFDKASSDDEKTRYVASLIDLDGDGKPEVVVYLVGRAWCGSGGCRTLVLARTDTS